MKGTEQYFLLVSHKLVLASFKPVDETLSCAYIQIKAI